MFHSFTASDGHTYGSFECFFHYKDDFSALPEECDFPSGWYWWACYPGCLPDGDPSGPFLTEQEAIKDATDWI